MDGTRPAPRPDDDGTAGAARRLYYWWEAYLFRLEKERRRLTRYLYVGRPAAGPKDLRDVDAEARKALTQLELWRWLHATRSY